jgi:aspartokinase/homoserine dehydrogenase 1
MPVMRYNIPITIRNVFNVGAPGTMIGRSSLPDLAEEAEPVPYNSTDSLVKGFATIDNIALVNVEGTGMVGVPGTASEIFEAVKGVGANVVMISQASSEHSVCFAVPEKEADTVYRSLMSKFRKELEAGRLSNVWCFQHFEPLLAQGLRCQIRKCDNSAHRCCYSFVPKLLALI